MSHNCYAMRNDRKFGLMNKRPNAQDCIMDWLVTWSASQVVSHIWIYEDTKWTEVARSDVRLWASVSLCSTTACSAVFPIVAEGRCRPIWPSWLLHLLRLQHYGICTAE
jgi:hypothetical protein